MPALFVLEYLDAHGRWGDWGVYRACDFSHQEDGAYVNTLNGSPLWLRCVRQDGEVVYCVDGAGDPYTYRLQSFPNERYSAA